METDKADKLYPKNLPFPPNPKTSFAHSGDALWFMKGAMTSLMQLIIQKGSSGAISSSEAGLTVSSR